MSKSSEIIKKAIPDDSIYEGKVKIGVDFNKISMLDGSALDDVLGKAFEEIDAKHEVIPQYRGFKEKLGGMMYGFYINPSVKSQNALNDAYKTSCEEFRRLNKEKMELIEQVKKLQVEILRLEQER